MPVDISMSAPLRRRRKFAGYAAICAVGVAERPGVFRIATAENVEAHIAGLQPGSWHKLHFDRVIWTPGLAVARTIVVNAEKFLSNTGHALGNHWFRVEDTGLLDELIVAEAQSLRAPLWSQDELVARLQAQADREADNFAKGIF